MKIDIAPMLRGVAISVAAAAVLAASSTVIKTAGAVSVLQAERLDDGQRLARIESKIDHLLEKADEPSKR